MVWIQTMVDLAGNFGDSISMMQSMRWYLVSFLGKVACLEQNSNTLMQR